MHGFFLLDKVVKLVGGGSVINGAYPVYFLSITNIVLYGVVLCSPLLYSVQYSIVVCSTLVYFTTQQFCVPTVHCKTVLFCTVYYNLPWSVVYSV